MLGSEVVAKIQEILKAYGDREVKVDPLASDPDFLFSYRSFSIDRVVLATPIDDKGKKAGESFIEIVVV